MKSTSHQIKDGLALFDYKFMSIRYCSLLLFVNYSSEAKNCTCVLGLTTVVEALTRICRLKTFSSLANHRAGHWISGIND